MTETPDLIELVFANALAYPRRASCRYKQKIRPSAPGFCELFAYIFREAKMLPPNSPLRDIVFDPLLRVHQLADRSLALPAPSSGREATPWRRQCRLVDS
jgi:hypothetical protein